LSTTSDYLTINSQEHPSSTPKDIDNTAIVINRDEYVPVYRLSEPPKINNKDIYADLVYPAIALKEGIEGRVILELFIDENGIIQHINVLQENPEYHGFKESAIRAFEGKIVTPAILNNKNVKCRYRHPVSFRTK
jgi:TonB family protein